VSKYKKTLDELIKRKIIETQAPHDLNVITSNDDLLRTLSEQSEALDHRIRNEAVNEWRQTHPDVFLPSDDMAGNRTTMGRGGLNLVMDIKDVRRRNVELFLQMLGANSSSRDYLYEQQMPKVQQLQSHMFLVGNTLAGALFAQKVAFSELQSQADIIFEVRQIYVQSNYVSVSSLLFIYICLV
jgi:hypothetical protein